MQTENLSSRVQIYFHWTTDHYSSQHIRASRLGNFWKAITSVHGNGKISNVGHMWDIQPSRGCWEATWCTTTTTKEQKNDSIITTVMNFYGSAIRTNKGDAKQIRSGHGLFSGPLQRKNVRLVSHQLSLRTWKYSSYAHTPSWELYQFLSLLQVTRNLRRCIWHLDTGNRWLAMEGSSVKKKMNLVCSELLEAPRKLFSSRLLLCSHASTSLALAIWEKEWCYHGRPSMVMVMLKQCLH